MPDAVSNPVASRADRWRYPQYLVHRYLTPFRLEIVERPFISTPDFVGHTCYRVLLFGVVVGYVDRSPRF